MNKIVRLTLSMIVKNEESYLRDCLESVKDIADEFLIVDTGSTDNTNIIAAEYNARIYNFEWINDFSAARNFALSKSSGSWILYLDADERLTKESIEPLRKIITKNEKAAYRCKIVSRNSLKNSSQIMHYSRLFYNTPDIKFSGAIHEQIDQSLIENDYKIYNSEIQIDHNGYDLSEDALKQKAKRNLDLLLREYKGNPSSYNAYQLGNTFQILGDEDKACEFFSIAVLDSKLNKEYQSICYLQLAASSLAAHQIHEAYNHCQLGLKSNPELPQLYLLSSQILFRLGQYDKALNDCLTCFQINDRVASGKTTSTYLLSSIDPQKPVYQGIYIAFLSSSHNWLNKYFDLLHKINGAAYKIVKQLISGSQINDLEIQQLIKIINSDNLQCYLALLENYPNSRFTFEISTLLLETFPNNAKLLTVVGKYCLESGEYNQAEKLFNTALQLEEKDASAAFYLISLLVQQNKFRKIPEILKTIEREFHNIPEVQEKTKIIKTKLAAFI